MPRLYAEPAHSQPLADADILTFTQNVDLGDDQFALEVLTGTLGELKAFVLASAALTGDPTAPTQTAGNNTTRIATTAFVVAAINALVDVAPGALDTLNELAAALGDDSNFAASVTSALAGKMPLAYLDINKELGGRNASDVKVPSQKAVYFALRASVGPGIKPEDDFLKSSATILDLSDEDDGSQFGLSGVDEVEEVVLVDEAEMVLKSTGTAKLMNSANLVIPGGLDIQLAIDDIVVLRGGEDDIVYIVGFVQADGTVVHPYIPAYGTNYPFIGV